MAGGCSMKLRGNYNADGRNMRIKCRRNAMYRENSKSVDAISYKQDIKDVGYPGSERLECKPDED